MCGIASLKNRRVKVSPLGDLNSIRERLRDVSEVHLRLQTLLTC
jgi:hypothetical protein